MNVYLLHLWNLYKNVGWHGVGFVNMHLFQSILNEAQLVAILKVLITIDKNFQNWNHKHKPYCLNVALYKPHVPYLVLLAYK